MPIYEYWCLKCRSQFEKLRPIDSKDADVSCPECGSPVKRMLSVVAAVRPVSEAGSYASGGGCGCGGGGCGCGRNN